MSFLRDPKRLIATLIAGVAGLIVLLDFAGPVGTIDMLALRLVNWAALVAALPLLGDGVRWLSDYVALAGARGLLLGAALGALVAGVRVLLGFDQPYLDR